MQMKNEGKQINISCDDVSNFTRRSSGKDLEGPVGPKHLDRNGLHFPRHESRDTRETLMETILPYHLPICHWLIGTLCRSSARLQAPFLSAPSSSHGPSTGDKTLPMGKPHTRCVSRSAPTPPQRDAARRSSQPKVESVDSTAGCSTQGACVLSSAVHGCPRIFSARSAITSRDHIDEKTKRLLEMGA